MTIKYADGKPVVDIARQQIGRKAKVHRGKPNEPGQDRLPGGHGVPLRPRRQRLRDARLQLPQQLRAAPSTASAPSGSRDNDDDGNQGVRINYVMEGGNFGFKGPQAAPTGAATTNVFPGQTSRRPTGTSAGPASCPTCSTPAAGSPTGHPASTRATCCREKFRGALIHCDAGPNVVRAYIPQPEQRAAQGDDASSDEKQERPRPARATRSRRVVKLVKGKDSGSARRTSASRRTARCSIADWYDPGVGGHATGDKRNDRRPPRPHLPRRAEGQQAVASRSSTSPARRGRSPR